MPRYKKVPTPPAIPPDPEEPIDWSDESLYDHLNWAVAQADGMLASDGEKFFFATTDNHATCAEMFADARTHRHAVQIAAALQTEYDIVTLDTWRYGWSRMHVPGRIGAVRRSDPDFIEKVVVWYAPTEESYHVFSATAEETGVHRAAKWVRAQTKRDR